MSFFTLIKKMKNYTFNNIVQQFGRPKTNLKNEVFLFKIYF